MKNNLILVIIIAIVVGTLAYLSTTTKEIPTSIKVIPAEKRQNNSSPLHKQVIQKETSLYSEDFFLHLSDSQ